MTSPAAKRLVLVGGGHAHLFVLERLARRELPGLEVILVSPSRWQLYSGMLPGWMAGVYQIEDCRIDLWHLVRRAGATMIEMPIVGMDADRQCVGLKDGRHLDYDLLSLDTGSETDLSWLAELSEKLLPVKPIADFQRAWLTMLEGAATNARFSLAIVGGGAAGIEIALAARHALDRIGLPATMTLVAGESGLMPGQSAGASRCAAKWLDRARIEVVLERAVGVNDGVLLSGGRHIEADRVIAATGPRPPVWLLRSKLHLDSQGYVSLDAFSRSRSHTNVFAAGDICARPYAAVPRSGVHAVRAGPVLAYNLLAAAQDRRLRQFQPRRRVLHLLAGGERRALLSFGPLSASGVWVWRWKDRIDRRFIARFS